jgi:catechol 2,3-dioxygenase-like lactoylglutathione lyase family enzyme
VTAEARPGLRLTLATALLLVPAALLAQSDTVRQHGPNSPARESLLGEPVAPFIALSVASLDRMLPWYRDTLGFRVHSTGTAPTGNIRFALLRHGDALIELLQLPNARPRTEAAPGTAGPHEIHGFFKSGVVVTDIDAAYRRARERGLTIAYELGQPPNGPYRSFGVRDPEGNLLQFFGR